MYEHKIRGTLVCLRHSFRKLRLLPFCCSVAVLSALSVVVVYAVPVVVVVIVVVVAAAAAVVVV